MKDVKFVYGQTVKVVKGFYRGRSGKIVNYIEGSSFIGIILFPHKYAVSFNREWESLYFDEECLEEEGEISGQEEEKTTTDI